MHYRSRLSIEVLRDFQLDVTVGESVAIVYAHLIRFLAPALIRGSSGKSGSGKSSVNALLLRYYDPIKGKITYDGQGLSYLLGDYALFIDVQPCRHPRVYPRVVA